MRLQFQVMVRLLAVFFQCFTEESFFGKAEKAMFFGFSITCKPSFLYIG